MFFLITKLIYFHGRYCFGTQKSSVAELSVHAVHVFQQLNQSTENFILVSDFDYSLNTKKIFFSMMERDLNVKLEI